MSEMIQTYFFVGGNLNIQSVSSLILDDTEVTLLISVVSRRHGFEIS